MMKRWLLNSYRWLSNFFVDPIHLWANYRAFPVFVRNFARYKKLNRDNPSFSVQEASWYFTTYDLFLPAGSIRNHYFFQDLWAAGEIYSRKIEKHVDVGSRLDGFVAHLLPFCKVSYVDIRPMETAVENLLFVQGSILAIPYADSSLSSLSCLHVLEHIGLGRYGDPVDPQGHLKAAKELIRVLAPGGYLLFAVPTGKEKLYFDAHRVFSPYTVEKMFDGLKLVNFKLIDDKANGINDHASFEDALQCHFGCGLYLFTKPSLHESAQMFESSIKLNESEV